MLLYELPRDELYLFLLYLPPVQLAQNYVALADFRLLVSSVFVMLVYSIWTSAGLYIVAMIYE